jgi:hypothetical protein
MVNWRPDARDPFNLPSWLPLAFIPVALLFTVVWWDWPLTRGLFAGIAAMELVRLLIPGAGPVAGLLALAVVWVALARLPAGRDRPTE